MTNQTREDWDLEVKEGEKRLEQIQKAKVQQAMAEEIQALILEHARKRLAEFPNPADSYVT